MHEHFVSFDDQNLITRLKEDTETFSDFVTGSNRG